MSSRVYVDSSTGEFYSGHTHSSPVDYRAVDDSGNWSLTYSTDINDTMICIDNQWYSLNTLLKDYLRDKKIITYMSMLLLKALKGTPEAFKLKEILNGEVVITENKQEDEIFGKLLEEI